MGGVAPRGGDHRSTAVDEAHHHGSCCGVGILAGSQAVARSSGGVGSSQEGVSLMVTRTVSPVSVAETAVIVTPQAVNDSPSASGAWSKYGSLLWLVPLPELF